jgi:hypothetical protein
MVNNTSTCGTLNYNFIAVPTQLFILLDYRIKLVLVSLIQVSTALANSNGWFYYSLDDLKKVCGLKSDKTVRACIETLYRLGIVKVQSRTFENNIGKRTANYYSLNFEEIAKYNEYSVYECLNIPELQIPMLDYTSSDYKTTYTATTVVDTNDEENEPTSVQNDTNEEIPTSDLENAPTALETSNPANVEEYTLSEVDEDVVNTFFYDEVDECPLTDDELREHERYIKEKELELAETPTEQIKVDGEVVETASVIPTDLNRVEKRSIYTNEKTEKLDESVKQKCAELVQRYVEMVIPSANESADKCNAALRYILDKYNNGFIDIETKDRLSRELINSRFTKHSI